MGYRKWIFISAVVAAAIGLTIVLILMAVSLYVRLLSSYTLSLAKEDSTPVRIIELQPEQSKSGYVLNVYGFRITFLGYDESENISTPTSNPNGVVYRISDEKTVTIMNSLKGKKRKHKYVI